MMHTKTRVRFNWPRVHWVLAAIVLLSTEMQMVRAQEAKSDVSAPIAAVRPKVLESHGIKRTDNYFWLRQRESQEVIDYLNAENAYTETQLASIKGMETELFEEIKGRIKQDDTSVPYSDRGYTYVTRFEEGKQYPIYCRTKDEAGSTEEIILDVNELAKGKSFCSVRSVRVSPNNQRLSFAVDFTGRRKYALRFKDLETGELMGDSISNVSGGATWAADSDTVFYVEKDPQTLRAYLVKRHRIGQAPDQDVVVF
ncbi:MAG: oligopeptidase B, partial [Planctomycetota bacterium]